MTKSIRQSTLQTLGLGSVLDIFRNGRLPVDAGDLVDRVFGDAGDRGSLVISGANGIVGAGKMMQLTSRLEPFGVKSISLSRPRTADGIGPQYPGLVEAVGKERADRIMGNTRSTRSPASTGSLPLRKTSVTEPSPSVWSVDCLIDFVISIHLLP